MTASPATIAMVGHPNVGKSALFQRLTGARVIVSNYPGTTVEISKAAVRSLPELTLLDTPGIITLPASSEDEAVTERVLLDEPLQAVLQVGDAKNLRRTLLLTMQLVETGLPVVLALNMLDEARSRGLHVDAAHLAGELGLPVILTVAVRGQGLAELSGALASVVPSPFKLSYPQPVEAALSQLTDLFPKSALQARALGLLWLSRDRLVESWLKERLTPERFQQLKTIRQQVCESLAFPPDNAIHQTRLDAVNRLIQQSLHRAQGKNRSLAESLSRLTTHPVWGLMVLALVLFGMYWFVGVFGAGTLVGLLEENLFARLLNPAVTGFIERISPHSLVTALLVGEYGLWTMGLTYAFALILPIVGAFFLAFGLLEDSGYLPRLAALSNRFFQALGLNGKAVLPMVLGLGCVTMATLTTRVLESKRERLLVTLLLALAVPCSAQLGVVMGMLASVSLGATLIWGSVVLLILLAIGFLAARLVPGERTSLIVELPPLRLPVFSNVITKTLARIEWYLKEVVPLFLLGACVMFAMDETGILVRLVKAGEPLVTGWLGLPPAASAAFLMGFMRRDFGATGLFIMQNQGLLSPIQVVTAMITITLFIPCIASIMVIAKERGWKVAAGMVTLIMPLALMVGGLANRLLLLIGWNG